MCVCVRACVHVCACVHARVRVCVFVGSFLATKVFIGNLPAMGRRWIIISRPVMKGGQLPTNQLHDINWGTLEYASHSPPLMSCNYYLFVCVCVCVCTLCVHVL